MKKIHSERNKSNWYRSDASNHDKPKSFLPRKKKAFGQHFLRKGLVVDHMIDRVLIESGKTVVMEIGCGDGFLTGAILSQTNCKKLLCFEIDQEWADIVRNKFSDTRLDLRLQNILDLDMQQELTPYAPIVLLANLPYQITFPIIFQIQKNKHLFQEGVIMIQEEVAQKILATSGRGYSATTIFLQYHFSWEKMEKVEPGAFVPPPKIFSRLLHFRPKFDLEPIPFEEEFWKFLKLCFKSPRQTLRNNLRTTHYKLELFSDEELGLRAQQLTFNQFLDLWKKIKSVQI